MALDEKETGTDPTNNPGPHSRRVAGMPRFHAMIPTTEPCCVLDAGESDNVSQRNLDIFINCNWVNTRWQCYSTHNQ